jgi:hypothetical protein
LRFPHHAVAQIFNSSIRETLVPDLWKEAEEIPIPKKNAIKEAENDLRPISFIPILSKTMKHFVANWLMAQINHLIDQRQFGALRGRSTAHALYPISTIPTTFLRNLINV